MKMELKINEQNINKKILSALQAKIQKLLDQVGCTDHEQAAHITGLSDDTTKLLIEVCCEKSKNKIEGALKKQSV